MASPTLLCLTASGAFFLTALLAGVWKWRAMLTRDDHQAPFYVDTAHRAALMYSFACLVLERFATESPFPPAVTLTAVGAPVAFFAVAIGTYLVLGFRNQTDNQFEHRTLATTHGMIALIIAEIGGFVVLFGGFVWDRLLR